MVGKNAVRRACVGLMAHVDAGKTTLSEQILLRAGVVRRAGRVDHGDAFMDGHAIEKARGITIFSEEASFDLRGVHITLMDTPGHVDFSGEMERALSVLDSAVLVVSCAEGVQSHTVTLMRMLKRRRVPVMIFLNKTDREGADVGAVMAQMKRLLTPDCVLMTQDAETLREEIAWRDEVLLDKHFDGTAAREDYLAGAARAFAAGELVPVLPGSALLGQGVDELLEAVGALCGKAWDEDAAFTGVVYRVRRIDGQRVCFVKAERGVLRARDEVATMNGAQKPHALYTSQGGRLTPRDSLRAGETAAVAGIAARPGERIGEGFGRTDGELVPLMSVRIAAKGRTTAQNLLAHLKELEEEDPLLHVRAEEGGADVGIMGAVQTQVLGELLAQRFGDEADFLPPRVIYKETVAAPVVGIGHYEPLRHYAEAWLRIEPGAPGSGVVYDAKVAPNSLDLNWQRLVGTHVMEREHPGVLTGGALTDVKITLIAGRSHLKHTEGGDFREATYRAIRQGLMQAQSVLLEPMVCFELAMAQDALARVTGELLRLGAELDAPVYDGDEVTLCGTCTAAAFWDYPTKFAASTRGHGRISSRFSCYAPCRNQDEIVEKIGYSPLADEKNPASSVFCSHGAGFYVAWDHVREWAHCEVEGV